MKYLPTSLLALLVATPALAQSDPALPAKDAEGRDVVVTASRSGEGVAVRDLPASVTLLTADQLQERQIRIVSDVLRDVPGVAVNRVGAIGGLTQVRIRGTEGNHVLVLLDGIEASDPYQGEFDFGTLIADESARVEVLRGQQSSLYGSDAIGGVIQYITSTGRERPGVGARIEGGSFGTVAGGARVAGFSDAVDYALSGSAYRTRGTPTARDGVRDVGSSSVGATAKLGWTPSAAFKLTGVGRYSYTDAERNDPQNDPAGPRFGYTVDSPGVRSRNQAYYGLARAELTEADGRWITALSGQLAITDRKGFTAAGRDSGDRGRRYKGSIETSYRIDGGRLVSRLTGAVDVERQTFQNTAPQSFAFQGRRSTTNVGLVAQYEGTLDEALQVGASVRRDENDRFDDVTTFRVQGGYRLASGLRVRGAYGTGVKNPDFFELYGFSDGRYIGNPDLRPEKSKGWEAGVDQDMAGGDVTIGATYFHSRLEDEIFTTYPAPAFVATPGNRQTSSPQRGVELFATARPFDRLRFDLAYTYLRARENGAAEVRRPKHVASVNTTLLSADHRLSGTLTVRYNGRQTDVTFTDPTYATSPVVALEDYVLVNLDTAYRLTDRLSLFGRIENLFDEDYEEVFSFRTPGRAAFGGVRARF